MQPVVAKAYLSPTLALLALDWEEAPQHADFLGFAIRRTPGFRSDDGKTVAASSWLPNRIDFNGPVPAGHPDVGSNQAPIQKFMWWDNRIDTPDMGGRFTYEIWPVLGEPGATRLYEEARASLSVDMPSHMNDNGIGSWFNRAVVRSQAFERICASLGIKRQTHPTAEQDVQLRTWLANGMEQVVPDFLDAAAASVGAIYHLTDRMFIIPAFKRNAAKPLRMVYDAGTSAAHSGAPNPNNNAVITLGKGIMHTARTHTNIMHDKFLVAGEAADGDLDRPARLVMGSANYTTEGLSEQANLMHVIESPALAACYRARADLLLADPTVAATVAANHGWSDAIEVGGATVRVAFSPEPKGGETQIPAILDAIANATSSVLFCLFSPTDEALRDACFKAGDRGLMMFGLINNISQPSEADIGADPATLPKDRLAALELYQRSRDKRDVIDGSYFSSKTAPAGFAPEFNLYPGSSMPPYAPVIIHHKFIVIDAETDHPVVYTGSANMSNNAQHRNDENLLEIRNDRALAAVYLAEFMRLYEHYRARAKEIDVNAGKTAPQVLQLGASFAAWGKKYFTPGDPAAKARTAMVG